MFSEFNFAADLNSTGQFGLKGRQWYTCTCQKKNLAISFSTKICDLFWVFFTFFSSFFKQIICQSSIFETNKSKDILILNSPLYWNVSVTPQYSTVRSILLFAVGLKNNLQGEWNQLKINFNIKEERNLESKMSLNSLKFILKYFTNCAKY